MSYIPRKPRKVNHKPWGNKSDQRIYQSQAWRRLRLEYLSENPWCKECKKKGRKVPATVVDHYRPIRFKGEVWDMDNFIGLCKQHHNSKTAIESHCKTYQEWQTKFNGR